MNTLPALLLAAAGVGIGHAVMPDHWLPLAVLSRTRRYRTARVLRLSMAAGLAHVLVSLVLGGILIVIGLQFRTTIARHTDIIVGGILLVTGAVFLVLDVLGKGHGHSHDAEGHHHGHAERRDNDGYDHDHRGHGHHAHGGHGHDHTQHGHDTHGHDTHGHDGHGHDGHDHESHGYDDLHHDNDGQVLERGRTATAVLEQPAPGDRSARGLAGVLIPFGAAASPDVTILPVFLAASAVGTNAALGSIAAFAVATVATIVGLTIATALGARLLTAGWIDRRANLITALTLVTIGALVAAGLI